MEFAQHVSPAFRKSAATFLSIAALGLSACAITAEGLELNAEGQGTQASLTFDWHSSDDFSGIMTAHFADGRQFSGPYFEITPQTQIDRLDPLWEGWAANHGWRHWHPGPGVVRHFNGNVLTNLSAKNGEHLRCRFQLLSPSLGMSGGGEGTCQFTDGSTVDAAIRPTGTEGIAVRR